GQGRVPQVRCGDGADVSVLRRSLCYRRLRVAVRPGAACPFCNKQNHCKTARWNPETKTEESAAGACCCGEGRAKDTLRIVLLRGATGCFRQQEKPGALRRRARSLPQLFGDNPFCRSSASMRRTMPAERREAILENRVKLTWAEWSARSEMDRRMTKGTRFRWHTWAT